MLERLGNYRIEKKLADGGMGAVYLGTSPDARVVVLKVPHRQDRNAAVALADEARAGLRLRHRAIIQTLDFFVDGGQCVLVVELVDGMSLFELRRRTGPLPPHAVAELGREIADALHALHGAADERGRPLHMIHRDVSPNNVLVDVEGQPRLIDLGIARSAERMQKATAAGMVKGTLRYLAPECLAGEEHTPASDVWALGVTLWEASIGRYAIAGDDILTMRAALDGSLRKKLATDPIDGRLRPVLEAFVAPTGVRINNARAAAAMLQRLTSTMPGGRGALAFAVRSAQATAPRGGAEADATEVAARDDLRAAMSNVSNPDVSNPDVTQELDRAAEIRAISTAPTKLQMPAASSAPPASMTLELPIVVVDDEPSSLEQSPPLDPETADTIQMPMWTPKKK